MGAFEELGYRAPSSGALAGGESPASPVLRAPQWAKDGECCAVPGCGRATPKSCVFCPEHHFALPPAYARAAIKARIACERAGTDPARATARATYAFTLKSCLAALPKTGGRPC